MKLTQLKYYYYQAHFILQVKHTCMYTNLSTFFVKDQEWFVFALYEYVGQILTGHSSLTKSSY